MEINKALSHYVVAESGCWEWKGWLHDGYGRVRIEGKSVMAHRLFYENHQGEIPQGLMVMHLCNNRKCVNPSHLLTGTNQDNMDYMVECGRSYRPIKEKNPWYGKHLSAETKAKLSASRKGKCCGKDNPNFGKRGKLNHLFGIERSAETKEKCRLAHIGKKFTDEHRANISKAKAGERHPNFGKKNSEETKAKRVASYLAAVARRKELTAQRESL